VLTLAACSGHSSGVTVQTDPTAASPTTAAPSVTATTSPFTPPSPSTSTTIAPAIQATQPTVQPSTPAQAQAAIAGFMAANAALDAADKDPAHADIAAINKHLAGPALTVFDQIIAGEKAEGLAYRGVPDNPRPKVSTVLSSTAVFLSSCPKPDAKDPSTEYVVKTGKGVPVTTTPNYRRDVAMKKIGSVWKIYNYTVNTSKLCAD
jgi:hypothetical protein